MTETVHSRDPLGLNTLYYHDDGTRIVVASRISELLKEPGVPKRPNVRMIGQFLSGEFISYEDTFFEGIRQVPPGHSLTVKNGRAVLTRFWWPEQIKLRRYADKRDYFEEFRLLFEKSVEEGLGTGSSAGLLLSGGLDSVQVCAVAETLIQKKSFLPRLKSVCLKAEGFLAEENEAVEALAGRFGSAIEFVDYSSGQEHASLFDLFMECGETPHLDGFMTTPLLLRNLANRGCKTVLTGFGANELSLPGETGYLTGLLLSLRPGKFLREARRYSEATLSPFSEVLGMLLGEASREFYPGAVRRMAKKQRNGKKTWLRREFRNLMDSTPALRLRPFREIARNKTCQALFEPLMPLGLAQMSEAAAQYGMEISHPFLNLDLIEFFLSIPPELKTEPGYRKSFVQAALAPVMPVPVKNTDDPRPAVKARPLKERRQVEFARLRRYLSNPDALLFNYADYSGVQALLWPQNPAPDYPTLWRLARLENWLQNFFGSRILVDDLALAP